MMDSLYLRPADYDDMQTLFAWANDPEVRANSFATKPISWQEHCKWFQGRLADPDARIYILLRENEPVGQVRLEKQGEAWRISYSIAKEYRGQGYGKAMLALLENWLLNHDLNIELLAEVKSNNVASQLVFAGLGYQESRTAKGYVYTKDVCKVRGTGEKMAFSLQGRQEPFIIAEMSGNHNQSLDRALAIVDAAAEAGVDALKIQTYTADTMTIDKSDAEFFIADKNSLWEGESLYDLYKKAYTPWEWHEAIFKRCREHGIIGFSTPFDATAVDFLEKLDVPCYKIASFENIDLPLIKKVAQTGKPIIASTGMATVAELDELVRTARENGCEDITLLKCTSSYPAAPDGTNLMTIPHMSKLFGCQAGLSDHTLGLGAAVASMALGARVVEKHFTLARAEGGVDSAFSLEPQEMAQLVRECHTACAALGEVHYGLSEQEKKSLQFRRSLYIVEDMQAGEVLTEKNLRSIRPGLGLPPKHYGLLLGRKVARAVKRGTPMSWELLD